MTDTNNGDTETIRTILADLNNIHDILDDPNNYLAMWTVLYERAAEHGYEIHDHPHDEPHINRVDIDDDNVIHLTYPAPDEDHNAANRIDLVRLAEIINQHPHTTD